MGSWNNLTDYEAERIEDYRGRFTLNFKKIYMDVGEISEKTLEVTDRHPKDALLKLWAGTMAGMFIFFCFSYRFFALFMVPFHAFYLIALVRVFRCWKSFRYSALQFWGMSVAALAVLFVLSRLIQHALELL